MENVVWLGAALYLLFREYTFSVASNSYELPEFLLWRNLLDGILPGFLLLFAL